MDKKKLTSWGVSFGSLALVAGMVSYLGLTNKTVKANHLSLPSVTSQNTDPQSQTLGGDQDQSSMDDNEGSSLSNGSDSQSADDNGVSSNSSSQDTSGFFGNHHHSFDTTTGGT